VKIAIRWSAASISCWCKLRLYVILLLTAEPICPPPRRAVFRSHDPNSSRSTRDKLASRPRPSFLRLQNTSTYPYIYCVRTSAFEYISDFVAIPHSFIRLLPGSKRLDRMVQIRGRNNPPLPFLSRGHVSRAKSRDVSRRYQPMPIGLSVAYYYPGHQPRLSFH